MTEGEQKSIIALCLTAALADGNKDSNEREELRRIADSLPDGSKLYWSVYQEVMGGQRTTAEWVNGITDPNLRTMAYEMAVCICDADGLLSPEEKRFLDELETLTSTAPTQGQAIRQRAAEVYQAADPSLLTRRGQVADVQFSEPPPMQPMMRSAPIATAMQTATPQAHTPVEEAPARERIQLSNYDRQQVDKMIINYAILNGALELLPQSLATMAIIPMQTKMVYRIGKTYGFSLDKGHIKEFLATVGIGMSSQVVEGFARKLVGGLVGGTAGKLVGKITSTATGSAMSFASTWALGKLADEYYGNNRSINTAALRARFHELVSKGKGMHSQHLPSIRQKASTLTPSSIASLVKGA